ncbi:hypothetical protein QVD17_03318 [Tagetes erecta]|uniref:RRM domain-containing protein n=1 Tax=Tagetes erecta TaxID=13708 RepID=A0AAD8L854_TARER|nr:hypothetical protein QVD17_03318 [Tagetes erecta]
MTIDDENSVYVGNLPYDSTEDTIRSVFDLYGQIIAVKIIGDRGVGGRCYGFVTFTNPRSAVNAINDMDGRTIDGRVVKVNEVKTRSGRSNFGRDNFRHNNNRDVEFDRGRDRDYGRERDRSRDQNREWSRDRDQGKERGFDRARDVDRSRDRFVDRERGHDRDQDLNDADLERERDYDRVRDVERARDRFVDRERGPDRDQDLDDVDLERERDYDQADMDQEKETIRRSGNKYKDQPAKLTNGSDISERRSREYPSGSSHGDHDQVAKQLDISRQKLEELQNEVSRMEELVEERGDHVLKLQEKSQKLEDALASARNLTLNRKRQLIKLYKCFHNVKDYGEKLRICEEELQSLVGSAFKELENHDGVDPDELPAN